MKPQDFIAQQDEINRRVKVLMDRLRKTQFLTGPDDERLTLVAMFYAGIILAAASGVVPCSSAVGIVGMIYQNAEKMTADQILQQIANDVRMAAPAVGSVQ